MNQPNDPTSSSRARQPSDAPVHSSVRLERQWERRATTAPRKIKVLEGLEAVRKRPAMYIGSTGAPGLHHLVYEIVDNSIDEALAGHCDQVNVTIHIDNSVTVVDNGRGIPVDRHESGKSAAEVVLTVLHAGGKFDNDSYKVSGGLHGVGVSVVNALSELLELEIWRNGQVYQQTYERGVPTADLEVTGTTKKRGTKVTFRPDTQIFETTEYSFDTLATAPARAGVPQRRRHDHDRRRARRQVAQVPLPGRHRLLRRVPEPEQGARSTRSRSTSHGEKDGIDVEIALQWNDGYAETLYSFANNINTHEGGTHLSGFRSALTRTVNSYAAKNNLDEGPEGRDDQRRRHPRGADRRHQRQDPAAAVRGADQDEARQHRGQGHRRGDRQRQARGVPRGEPERRQAGHPEGGRRRARARSGAQGPRPRPPQGGARQQRPAGQAGRLPGARSRAQRDLHRRRRVGRRLGEAGARSALPGDPADQGQDPERREGPLRQDARQRRNQDDDRGARHAASAPRTSTSPSSATTGSSS